MDRLYLHLLVWPFKHVELAGLRRRVEYAQLLDDGSELHTVGCTRPAPMGWTGSEKSNLVLDTPVQKPPVVAPVIEQLLEG